MTQPDSLVISQVHALARAAAARVFFSRVAQVEQLLRLHGFHRAVAGLKLDLFNADDQPFAAVAARLSTVR